MYCSECSFIHFSRDTIQFLKKSLGYLVLSPLVRALFLEYINCCWESYSFDDELDRML